MFQSIGPDGPRPTIGHHELPRRRRGPGGRWLVLPAVAALLALLMTSLLGSTAVAAPATLQPEVSIRPVAVMSGDGATLTVSMVVRCAPTEHMMEGFANVEQGAIALLSGFAVVCDGRRHLTQATFSSSDANGGPFLAGRAHVQAIIFDEAIGTSVAEASRTVLVRP